MRKVHQHETWDVDRGDATPESVFLGRRAFVKAAGLAGAGNRHETIVYGGYGQFVAHQYKGMSSSAFLVFRAAGLKPARIVERGRYFSGS